MGWETRRGHGRYYTRSRRVDGRIVRQYLGTGPAAELAATSDALARVQRQIEARAEQEAQQRYEELTVPLEELARLTDLLFKATLTSAGYHQHHRGQWRRRRHVPEQSNNPEDVCARVACTAGQGHQGRSDSAA